MKLNEINLRNEARFSRRKDLTTVRQLILKQGQLLMIKNFPKFPGKSNLKENLNRYKDFYLIFGQFGPDLPYLELYESEESSLRGEYLKQYSLKNVYEVGITNEVVRVFQKPRPVLWIKCDENILKFTSQEKLILREWQKQLVSRLKELNIITNLDGENIYTRIPASKYEDCW